MKPKQLLDPLALWRQSIDRLESGANDIATRNMTTDQFSQALSLLLRASLGTHHLVDKNLARAYERLGLPSRSDVEAIANAVRRIEDKLDQLLPPPVPAKRPARTRRAPAAVAHLSQRQKDEVAAPVAASKQATAPVETGRRRPQAQGVQR